MKFFGRKEKPKKPTESWAPETESKAAAEVQSVKDGGLYSQFRRGLSRTGGHFSNGLGALFLGRKVIDEAVLEALEDQLLSADVGIEATRRIVSIITERISRKELSDGAAVIAATKAALLDILKPCEQPLVTDNQTPFVILVVGVNGAGKTTTIGKLAHGFKAQGKQVMLAAGDTFRAAAVEQLQAWGARNEVPVIAQHTGADSASVLFDALQAANARGVDILLADTAGRLQNKSHLMDELEKVVRVMQKVDPQAPHETLLVLDAGTGQNAVSQAEEFDKAVGVSGIALSKLDGTARGGVIFAIAQKLARPIRFVGIGEGMTDLQPFDANAFVDALFESESS
jgi:fused signal recognition particle receptor